MVKLKADQVRRMAHAAVEQLVRQVEAGKSEVLKQYLKTMAKFHRYSVGNAMLIGFQRPDATHVAGFRAWRRLGRYVKKGEHGIAIMAPIVYRREIETGEADDKETEDEILRTFKTVHVFDISQTDGKPLPDFARVKGDPRQFMERLKEFATAKRITVKHTLMTAEGASTGGIILLKQGLKPAEEFSVFCHELAHEILHRYRESTPKEKKVRETEAEAVAFVVCQGVGLDVSSASSDYIQLYDGDKKTLLQSLERIQRTAAEILGAITEDGKPRIETGRESVYSVAAA